MISVYIHIPFCNSICTYCDFCKVYRSDRWINLYLDSLSKEIEKNYRGQVVKSLYIGGGTPSCLGINYLKKLFSILGVFNLADDAEISFEANSEDLSLEVLEYLASRVNRLSIGVQSFDEDILKLLGRKVNYSNIVLAKKYFSNISVDLIYGFNEESKDVLIKDLEKVISLDVPHISVYNLIVEPNTKLYISGYKKNDEDIYSEEIINNILKANGYNHYEVSNYARVGFESKHNLVYWNNDEYYGFGLGACGYVDGVRYENTRSLNKYLDGKCVYESHKLDFNEKLQNEFILGFRKLKGINKKIFKRKYGFDIKSVRVVCELLEKDEILENDEYIYINPKYLYYSNEILLKFMENNLHEQEFVV